MPQFLTRVELHGAVGDDYTRLHAAMEAQRFHRFITADDGAKYQLPTAEYFSHGPTLKAEEVRALAAAAAASVGRKHWILVAEFTKAAWQLPPVPVNALGAMARALGG